MTIVVSRKDLNTIVDALIEAVEYIEYYGYGDSWEMVERLDAASELGELMVGKS